MENNELYDLIFNDSNLDAGKEHDSKESLFSLVSDSRKPKPSKTMVAYSTSIPLEKDVMSWHELTIRER